MIPIETFIENLVTEPDYKVDKVNVRVFGDPEPMFKLSIKVHDCWIPIVRKDCYFPSYLNDLKEMGSKHKQELGVFCHYGNGKPLEECATELRKDYTHFAELAEGIYVFAGNHEHFSSAFQYYVWNRGVIEAIQYSLMFQGFKRDSDGLWRFPKAVCNMSDLKGEK
jgi:hypothetical protein